MASIGDTTQAPANPDRLRLWTAVDALADRLLEGGLDERRIRALRGHRVSLLAAARLRARGEDIPDPLGRDERTAALVALAIPALLRRVRAAVDGPLMLMKGPEVAALYPDALQRPCVDLDLLAADPHDAHRALLAAGFPVLEDIDWPGSHHHLPPLEWPGLPVAAEVHIRPNWIDGMRPPPVDELFEAAGPSRLGVPGLLAPGSEHHALLLATHAWAHRPLGRLGDLIDVEALSLEADETRLDAVARDWGCTRLWRSTRRAADDVLATRGSSLALRIWARHLREGRDRTVLAAHLQRWLAPAWAVPRRRVFTVTTAAVARDLLPFGDEGWARKATRMRRALADTRIAEADHLQRADVVGVETAQR